MIFPFFEDVAIAEDTEKVFPPYKDIAWDYENNKPRMKNGDFEFATGIEAIKGWIYRTIQCTRYRHEIYSWDYGNELSDLIGKAFNALSRSEAERLIKESLLINRYITKVDVTQIEMSEGRVKIKVNVETIYGNASVSGVTS